MHDAEAVERAEEGLGVLRAADDVGAVADQAELVCELGDEARVALEARAEHEPDGRCRGFGDERLKGFAQRPIGEAGLHASRQAARSVRELVRIEVAEAIDDQRQEAGPPRGRCKRPRGKGCDEDGFAAQAVS